MKIQLNMLTWPDIEATVKRGEPIVVNLDMTGRRGGRICGTVGRENMVWDL